MAESAESQFSDFVGRTKAHASSLSGEFIVTSLNVAVPVVMPMLVAFQRQHPKLAVRYDVSPRIYRLEYGEAHVAIRGGVKPEGPDNVVRSYTKIRFGLFASRDYAETFGIPKSSADFGDHAFVGMNLDQARNPLHMWMEKRVPEESIVFRSTSPTAAEEAVVAGAGIGFLPLYRADHRHDLVLVMPYRRPWDVTCWFVTHVDLHRSAKVQAFLRAFRATEAPRDDRPG